jgi:hypothetical protein
MGSGVGGWGTSPAEPWHEGHGCQRPLRSRLRQQLTPGISRMWSREGSQEAFWHFLLRAKCCTVVCSWGSASRPWGRRARECP